MRYLTQLFLLLLMLVLCSPQQALADEVTDWNEHLINAVITGGAAGLLPVRHAAIVHSAVFDAVNGIEQRYEPIHVQPNAAPGASKRAAAVQAAYASLVKLFPAQQTDLDAKRAASLNGIASSDAAENSQSIARGIAWGQQVADAIWAWRLTDGFSPAPPPDFGQDLPGVWRSTPPALLPFALKQFAIMTPFALQSSSQFPLPGPDSMTSAKYTADFAEVKSYGSMTSTTRSQTQTDIARFWASANSPVYFWDRVASRLAAERHTNLSENARLFALLNMSLADAGMAVWNGKDKYRFWRPISAIRLADQDGNPATLPDTGWTPLITTPPYPDYPSGLCGTSGGAVGILAAFFGEKTSFILDSNGLPNVVRFFPDFQSALNECVDARVLSGIHFRTADVDGAVLGLKVANYIFNNKLQPLHGNRNGQVKK